MERLNFSIIGINGKWYVFYHRHTNETNFSRQGCIESIEILEDGTIEQVEMTSCGPNGGPLIGKGEYPAYLACNLFCKHVSSMTAGPGDWMDCRFPKITQDGKDGDRESGYIATNEWKEYSLDILIPDGVHAFYFWYVGRSQASLASFTLE